MHKGYASLIKLANPKFKIYSCFVDDFEVIQKNWDLEVLKLYKNINLKYFIIHQRPHPPQRDQPSNGFDNSLNKNLFFKKFNFYISDTNKTYINKEKKLKLTFSGFLNGFRTAELEKLLKNKNNFFDYSLIEEVLKFKTPRFIVQNKDTNICSLHIRKSKNWLYSSPTRYINSLEKNEIPIVLDNFNDYIISNLFLNKDFLNCKNFEKVDKYLNNLN